MTGKLRSGIMVALLILSSALVISCDDQRVVRWCDTYQRGYSYVISFAYPALDAAVGFGVKPELVPAYEASKLALGAVNNQLVGVCERYRSGQRVEVRDIAPLVADGTRILADIIRLYKEVVAVERDVRASDPSALLVDLESVSAEAGRIYRR
jgi:hypothetical protein